MARPGIWLPESKGKIDQSEQDHGHVIHGMGWFEPYNITRDQEASANMNMALIRSRCDELYRLGRIQECKWTNDPLVFPLTESESPHRFQMEGQTDFTEGIKPFPPNDQQYYICGIYDPQRSYLTASAKPGHDMYTEGLDVTNSAWVRLCDFSQHDGSMNVFSEKGQKGFHMGRVMQGALDTGYLIEALNAVTLRPRLVRHLFYAHDLEKSAYIIRLYKHGMWHRIEVDDYVPVSPPPTAHHENKGPICCTSEHFPHVLWPSLVEKGFAKLMTHRATIMGDTPSDTGGWEAIGAGGRVEDALVLLTGGTAGRFRTREVSADRLFIYLFERQNDTLFVCRVNQPACDLYGVRLNPYYSYSVNRAVPWEGRLYVQVFCGAPTCYDGGLQDTAVPYSLTHCADYPEHEDEGFFWCDINDFHMYFDTIIECHLTSTPDSAIPGMPEPRSPEWAKVLANQASRPMRFGVSNGQGQNFGPQGARMPSFVEGEQVQYFESVHANPGVITKHNAPEFTIELPSNHNGCEVFCSFDQYDERILMDNPVCKAPAQILLKAYVKVNDAVYKNMQRDIFCKDLVCKSNWFPCNHSMLGFSCRQGCKIKIVVEFPDGPTQTVEKSVFRVYCSLPNFTVSAAVANKGHALGELPEGETPGAVKWSLVGCVDAALMEFPDRPEEFDPSTDGLRKPEQDCNRSWSELKQECSVM